MSGFSQFRDLSSQPARINIFRLEVHCVDKLFLKRMWQNWTYTAISPQYPTFELNIRAKIDAAMVYVQRRNVSLSWN